MRIWPSWRRAYSSGMGSLTLRIISACRQTWSAVSIMSAPARSYRCSYSDEPSPAPFWTRTRCPAWVSSRAPSGVRATRYSLSLTSLGTPTINGRSSIQVGFSRPAYRAGIGHMGTPRVPRGDLRSSHSAFRPEGGPTPSWHRESGRRGRRRELGRGAGVPLPPLLLPRPQRLDVPSAKPRFLQNLASRTADGILPLDVVDARRDLQKDFPHRLPHLLDQQDVTGLGQSDHGASTGMANHLALAHRPLLDHDADQLAPEDFP